MLRSKSLGIFQFLGFQESGGQDFHEEEDHLYELLRTHNESSKTIVSVLKNFKNSYPLLLIDIASSDIWPNEGPAISVKTHLKSTLSHATTLLKNTGRTLNADDEKYLQLLLTHPCGWSATYSDHMNDSWVEFFHLCYPNLDLVPILDSTTYAEELVLLPETMMPTIPQFFLLVNDDSYFVFNLADGEENLFRAGNTLEEVYTGMRDWRWTEMPDNMWQIVKANENIWPSSYFPFYFREQDGTISCSIKNDNEK